MALSPDIARMLAEATQRYGLPDGYLPRTAMIESSGNPRAQNPNSSAGGLFQFIDSTWGKYGGGASKFDPAAATDAAARLARDNQQYLTRTLGRDVTPAELYLAHQQGAGGAAKILSNPDAAASSIVGGKAVALNGGTPGMTAGDLAGLWAGKFNGLPSSTTAATMNGNAGTRGGANAGLDRTAAAAPTPEAAAAATTDDYAEVMKILEQLAPPKPAAQATPQAALPAEQSALAALAQEPQAPPPTFDPQRFYALLRR